LGTIYKKVNEKPKTTDISLDQPKNTYIADFKIEKNDIVILVKGIAGSNISDKIVIIDKLGKTPKITLNLSKE
jgi:hypothetical protein